MIQFFLSICVLKYVVPLLSLVESIGTNWLKETAVI